VAVAVARVGALPAAERTSGSILGAARARGLFPRALFTWLDAENGRRPPFQYLSREVVRHMATIYPKAEILFPSHLIPQLRDLRGEEWRALVERVAALPEAHPDSMAFALMMIRLDGCLDCFGGSYKFMRGCALCARQTIMQFKGTDADLVKMYNKAQKDLARYLEEHEAELPAEVLEAKRVSSQTERA
jgi:hypothetical protein